MNEEQFNSLKADMTDIKSAVIGDANLRRKGLIERVEDIETRFSRLDLRIASVTGAVVVVTFIVKFLFSK